MLLSMLELKPKNLLVLIETSIIELHTGPGTGAVLVRVPVAMIEVYLSY